MKEILIVFIIALIIGSIINGINQQGSSVGLGSKQTALESRPVQSVDESTFDQEVLASKIPVLVNFYTQTCPHCKNMAPVLSEIGAEHPEAKIVKVDAMANPALAQRYNVGPVPAFVVFVHGNKVEFAEGEMPKDDLSALVLKHLDQS